MTLTFVDEPGQPLVHAPGPGSTAALRRCSKHGGATWSSGPTPCPGPGTAGKGQGSASGRPRRRYVLNVWARDGHAAPPGRSWWRRGGWSPWRGPWPWNRTRLGGPPRARPGSPVGEPPGAAGDRGRFRRCPGRRGLGPAGGRPPREASTEARSKWPRTAYWGEFAAVGHGNGRRINLGLA